MVLNIPNNREIDAGIITSGSCCSIEAQREFDRKQAGRPPLDEFYPPAEDCPPQGPPEAGLFASSRESPMRITLETDNAQAEAALQRLADGIADPSPALREIGRFCGKRRPCLVHAAQPILHAYTMRNERQGWRKIP